MKGFGRAWSFWNDTLAKYWLGGWLPFLLLSPEISLGLAGFFVDAYFILLLGLSVWFVFGERGAKLQLRSGQFIKVSLILAVTCFLSVFFIQLLLSDESVGVRAHLVSSEGREAGTFGTLKFSASLAYSSLFRALTFIVFTYMLAWCLSLSSRRGRISFAYGVIGVACVYQAFWYFMYFCGEHVTLAKLLMPELIGTVGVEKIATTRFGIPRFSAGFSEPSFMSVVVFAASYVISFLGASRKGAGVALIGVLFLIVTTMSLTMLVAAFTLISAMFAPRILSIGLLLVITVLQFLYLILSSGFVPDELYSVVVRLFMQTDLATLSPSQVLFGVAFGQVYNFLPLHNLIVQLGLVFSVFLFFTRSAFVVPPVFVVLLVAPSLSHVWVYLSVAIIIGCCGKSRNRIDYE